MSAIAAAQAFVDRFNAEYEAKHEAFERQFWGKEKKNSYRNYSVCQCVSLPLLVVDEK